MRHPNILAFKDTLELEEKHETVIYVVTEPVTPLEELLAELDVQGEARCAAHLSQSSVQGAGQRACTAVENGRAGCGYGGQDITSLLLCSCPWPEALKE